jgi:hypothetical protein
MSIQLTDNELELIRNALRIASDKIILDSWNNQDGDSRAEGGNDRDEDESVDVSPELTLNPFHFLQ